MAINEAQAAVQQTGDLEVPLAIRNAPTQLMKDLNYGGGYKYAHDYENNFVEMEFLPIELQGIRFYNPGNNASEYKQREYLKKCWKDKYEY